MLTKWLLWFKQFQYVTDSKIKMFQAGIWLYPELTSQMLCMKDSQQILKESQP